MTADFDGGAPAPLTPAQQRTFDGLLAVGLPRPYAADGLADRLTERLRPAVATVASGWTEPRLFATKGLLATVRRCEGQSVADADRPQGGTVPLPTAVGIAAHRAIQMAHTHPGRPVGHYVDAVLAAGDDSGLSRTVAEADDLTVSDLRTRAVERVAAFLDSWPPLDERWTPRFEGALQARIGPLTLAARPDLTLGRPRSDGRQTMFIVDLKTGSLHDSHADEAAFYALTATLRFGVPPFRSTVYSLASGEHTDADVDEASLLSAADWTADAVIRLVEVRTGVRAAALTPGRHCSWCPAATVCPSADPQAGRAPSGQPAPTSGASAEPQPAAPGRFLLDETG